MKNETPLARAGAGCRGAVECVHDTLSAPSTQDYFIVFPLILSPLPGGMVECREEAR